MQSIQTTIPKSYVQNNTSFPLVTRFIKWCEAQDKNRFAWLAVILAIHGCVLAPIAIALILATGVHMLPFSIVVFSMTFSLISNLSAMPTKITIPVFFAGALVDLIVIAGAVMEIFK